MSMSNNLMGCSHFQPFKMDKVMCLCVHYAYLPCPQQTTSCHQGSQRTALEFLEVSHCNMICFCPVIKNERFKNNVILSINKKFILLVDNFFTSVIHRFIQSITHKVSIAELDKSIAEVHRLVFQDVNSQLLFFSFPT